MRKGFRGNAVTAVGALAAILVLLARAPIAEAITEAERSFLALYFTAEELQVVSATRSLQSIARIAENVTVVTAADIELMNAHTVEDVLNTIPGVKTSSAAQIATAGSPVVQGPDIRHVTVLLNGVPLNNLSDNVAIPGTIPVQDIDKIEVVRGPASSAWGSAMGGVVNVITKGPATGPFQGTASLDYGSENTGDYRAAVSGTIGRLGYRLSGTNLRTDGLIDGFDLDAGHAGVGLDYAFGGGTSASFSLFYGDTDRGDGVDRPYDLAWSMRHKHLVSQVGVTAGAGEAGRVDLNAWTTRFDNDFFMSVLSNRTELSHISLSERRSGASAKYAAGVGGHALVAGIDLSKGTLDASTIVAADPEQEQGAVFVNDTVTLGRLTLAPGIRYDDVSTSGRFWSPSLGVTWLVAKDTLLRATVARGFSVPALSGTVDSDINRYRGNPHLDVEQMWSYQAGFESGILDALWLKVTAYQHDVKDAIQDKALEDDWWTRVNVARQRRKGIDVEVKTKPVRGFTLAGSACFLKVKDLETGEDLIDLPEEMYDVSLKYDGGGSFRGLVKGRYVRQEEPESYNADFSGVLVDLNLAQKLVAGPRLTLEAFLSVHNLLDQAQYHHPVYPNPDRWVEGGLRASF